MRVRLRRLWPQAVLTVLALAFVCAGSSLARANPGAKAGAESVALAELEADLREAAPSLDPRVLALALRSHRHAMQRGLLADPSTLTVID
jgi:hypothetical protein